VSRLAKINRFCYKGKNNNLIYLFQIVIFLAQVYLKVRKRHLPLSGTATDG